MKIRNTFIIWWGLEFLSLLPACAAIGLAPFGPLQPSAHAAGPAEDICRDIPGPEIAKAVGGHVLETKSLEGRCVYIVGFKGAAKPSRAFVIYRHDAAAYDGLKEAMEGKIKRLKGIGDEAVMSFDSTTERYWLLVVKRKMAAYQVSGDDEELVLKVAAAALKQSAP